MGCLFFAVSETGEEVSATFEENSFTGNYADVSYTIVDGSGT